MTDIARLKKYQEFLHSEKFDTKLYASAEEYRIPFLAVHLGKDQDNRDRILVIKAQKQIMGDAILSDTSGSSTPIIHLDFTLEYPFKFKPETTKELASLLHFINHEAAVTGYCMDEVEQTIYYRYHMFSLEGSLDRKTLVSIVGMILLFYDIYHKTIEQVANGSITFNELIAQVLLLAKQTDPFKQH